MSLETPGLDTCGWAMAVGHLLLACYFLEQTPCRHVHNQQGMLDCKDHCLLDKAMILETPQLDTCGWTMAVGGNGPEDTGLGSTCTGSSAAGAKCNSGASSWLLPGIVIEAGGYNMASTRISWWLNTTVRQIWIHTFLCVFYFWLAMQTEDY